MRLSRRAADALADRVLFEAISQGLLPRGDHPDWARFAMLKARINAEFCVPETTVTPLLARVLYGIACLLRPDRVLGIGTYAGNAFAWLTAPGFGPDPVYSGRRAVAVDPDPLAVELARENMSPLGGWRIEHQKLDGHRAPTRLGDRWDTLWLDADDPRLRKGVYSSLLDATYPFLVPGALVVAHDVVVPKFAPAFRAYQERTSDRSRFSSTATFAIDPCGIEISVKSRDVPLVSERLAR